MLSDERLRLRDSRARILVVITVFVLSGCCTLTKSETSNRFSQLESEHIAFIDAYATGPAGSPQKTWDEAGFQSKVQAINRDFTSAASDAGIRYCPARKQFLANSQALFNKDAEFIETHHLISPSFAQNKKTQIAQNYSSFSGQ
jgi:hypothetical protein